MRTSEVVQEAARALRQRMTPAECLLWQHLRARRLAGYKFRRQHPVGPYVADFYCAAARLIVELDGPIHDRTLDEDAARSTELEKRVYRIIRFRNKEVLDNVASVLERIATACGRTDEV